MNQDVNDPRISEAYRDAATETAPDALNQSVLQEARQQATSGDLYARSVFWLRPMAWAATIGLCLAIVVELSDVPRPEPGLLRLPPAAPSPANMDAIEEIVVETEQDSPQESATAEQASEMQRARKSVDEEGRVTLSDLLQLEKAESMTAEPAVEPAAEEFAFEMPNRDIVAEAEALARRHEGKNIRSDTSGFAVSAAPAVAIAIESPCDSEARTEPQSWLACIEDLEADGMNELAAWQREELHAAFPEFELP